MPITLAERGAAAEREFAQLEAASKRDAVSPLPMAALAALRAEDRASSSTHQATYEGRFAFDPKLRSWSPPSLADVALKPLPYGASGSSPSYAPWLAKALIGKAAERHFLVPRKPKSLVEASETHSESEDEILWENQRYGNGDVKDEHLLEPSSLASFEIAVAPALPTSCQLAATRDVCDGTESPDGGEAIPEAMAPVAEATSSAPPPRHDDDEGHGETLSHAHCAFKDEDMRQLVSTLALEHQAGVTRKQAGTTTQMTALALHGNDLTDASVPSIVELITTGALPELQRLSVDGNRFTAEGKVAIKAACEARGIFCRVCRQFSH